MTGSARPLLLAVYLTGTVLTPALHLFFHDVDHDHAGGGIRLHSHGETSHEHPHAHPHEPSGHGAEDGHNGEDNSHTPEHGANSTAHFDAYISDGVGYVDPLSIPDRVLLQNAQHRHSRPEVLDCSRVRDRSPPHDQNRLT